MIMESAWSATFASTTGSIEMHDDKHLSNFEDYFRSFIMQEINRLKIENFLHEYFPLIDENGK